MIQLQYTDFKIIRDHYLRVKIWRRCFRRTLSTSKAVFF